MRGGHEQDTRGKQERRDVRSEVRGAKHRREAVVQMLWEERKATQGKSWQLVERISTNQVSFL